MSLADSETSPVRASVWTAASIGILAFAACDMVHEVLGHGVACALSRDVDAISLSTVALQTSSSSRLVAAAGTIANLVVGVVALILFRRRPTFGPAGYFLWLVAATNLLNGTGYLLFSALLDFGDWSVVIGGLAPHAGWRVLLGVLGVTSYAGVIRVAAAQLVPVIRRGELDRRDLPRLVFAAYAAGSLLFVAGAVPNPVGPQLILLSGVSSGFGAMAGLALVPRIADSRTRGSANTASPLPLSVPWLAAGVLVALVFVGLIGPGVRLS